MSSLDLHELRARLRYDPETGEFTTLEEAHRAYLQAAKGIHGEFLP